ncbi:MAG: transcriptional repressor LexA [Desulfotomaculum sp.]|nr:transcriptional repressor LexA [Desulfotomaculum sp.]
MSTVLNNREQSILAVIKEHLRQKGYPPSVREIGQAVGLSSSSTVHGYLKKLEQKGYLQRDPTKPRAITILNNADQPENNHITSTDDELVKVPVLGQVAAGLPLLATENYENTVTLPRDFIGFGELFMLKIRGDSMIEIGMMEDDLVLVRRQPNAVNGEIVVALLDDEATVKRFFKEKKHIRLQPENKNMAPILVQDVKILGKVTGLLRQF